MSHRQRAAWLSIALAATSAATEEGAIRAPIPFNAAEAVIEPFWSTELSEFAAWTVDDGTAHGLRIAQNWSAVDFEWTSKPVSGPALRMSRAVHVDCRRYTRLIVRLAPPKAAIVRIVADTPDKGPRAFVSDPGEGRETEYALDLDGASAIKRITIEIEPTIEGGAAGWLRWVGLQNPAAMEVYFAQWDFSGMPWDKYLRLVDLEPAYAPRYGIFLTPEELASLRAEHAEAMRTAGRSRFSDLAEAARTMDFEHGIHEYANTGGDTDGHSRARDAAQPQLPGSAKLAEAALVLQDADLMRAAGRYALSLALSEHWEHGFMSNLPGGPWEDRAFRRSYISNDIATILDLAGDVFTETGRLYLMRRLAEEGIGPINYVTWRHEYIFHCNQLAYFNTGRMYAYLVLEREWPRVAPYTDLALNDALDNLNTVILPDGGSLEGPTYLAPTVRENFYAIQHYARARHRELAALLPENLQRTACFAAAIASTTEQDVIPICDAGPEFSGAALEVLTELMPNSHWTTMYNKRARREGRPSLPQSGPPAPAFVHLPDTGYIASTRPLDGEFVKLFIMGHNKAADHTHEDKGGFVLEFAGEALAMDLGICDYDDPIHIEYKQCQRHNMLVPVGMPERARPQRPIPFDVKPSGRGDEVAFYATIDATPGWSGYYKKWVRTWDSPAPDHITIQDEYELTKGSGVEFYWQTLLPCRVEDHAVVITGARGQAEIRFPEDCRLRIESLPMSGGQKHTRIAIGRDGPEGALDVDVRLRVLRPAADQ
ncbi:MAG TPA: heparinase II/III family protein [Candidatus Hydrogenedentes bacterium]|nr:heparinase II/III family protein [Candidatus Hydrogenedentota bacterium]HPG68055.1 heparinase II/III family protein [Candidatus Hydrogenedentota bacterium]